MKKIQSIFLCSCIFVGLFYSSVAVSKTLDGIGIVDIRFAVFQTKKATELSAKLTKDIESHISSMKKLETEIKSAQTKLTKEKDTLSPKQQKELSIDFQQKVGQFQKIRSQIEQLKASEEQKLLISYKDALEQSIEVIRKKHKIYLLLNRESVAYLHPSMVKKDVTRELTTKLNEWDAKKK